MNPEEAPRHTVKRHRVFMAARLHQESSAAADRPLAAGGTGSRSDSPLQAARHKNREPTTIFLNEDNGPPRSVGSYRRLPLRTSDRS